MENSPEALVSKSLRNRVMVSYALCAIAESEVHTGDLNRALQTVKAIRKLMAEINLLVSDPVTNSTSDIREACELLAELECRCLAIESALRPHLVD